MNADHYITLLIRKWKNELPPGEGAELDAWLSASAENQALAAEMRKAWEGGELYDLPFPLDEQAGFDRMWQKLENEPSVQARQEGAKIVPMRPNRNRWLAVAAGIALLLAAGWWLFGGKGHVREMTLATANEVRQLTLSDGSQVWLNKNSRLVYPEKFVGGERQVALEGEAFFDVAKDAAKPFRIAIPEAEVTVLGTSFNVRAQPGESRVEVAVQTGRVRLQPKGSGQFIELAPNQRGLFDVNQNSLQTLPDDNLNALAWQRKRLVFRDNPLEDVAAELAKFYGVSIRVEAAGMRQCPFTGRFDTTRTLDEVLGEMAAVLGMKVEMEGEGFLLRGGSCR